MTNLDSILKSRDITLSTKVCLVKAMVFPVVMYGCESWTIKKAERRRIDAFELWCWRRLLRVPWTAGRSNQSILKEISPEYSLEGLMLKLKLQYFGHLKQRVDSFEKTLMLGKIESRRRRGQQRMNGWMASLTQWTWVWVDAGSWWWTGRPGALWFMGSQRVRHDLATELNWLWLSLRFEDLHLFRSSFFVCDNAIPNKTIFVKSEFLSWLINWLPQILFGTSLQETLICSVMKHLKGTMSRWLLQNKPKENPVWTPSHSAGMGSLLGLWHRSHQKLKYAVHFSSRKLLKHQPSTKTYFKEW